MFIVNSCRGGQGGNEQPDTVRSVDRALQKQEAPIIAVHYGLAFNLHSTENHLPRTSIDFSI